MVVNIKWIYLIFLYIAIVQAKDIGISVNITLQSNTTSNITYRFERDIITVNSSLRYFIINQTWINKPLIYRCWMDDNMVAFLKNWTDFSLSSFVYDPVVIDVQTIIVAKRLGGSRLICAIVMKNENDTFDIVYEDMVVWLIVKRIPTIQETIFRFVVMFFVIFLTFVMGSGLERDIIVEYLKRPISPAIGFSCQFLFMPLNAFGLAKLTNIDNAFAFGLLTIGCSPGGGASNIWTILFGGDMNLSMTMTFISSCSALFMMPFWLFVLGRFFIDPRVVKVPYLDIGLNLLQVMIPVACGMLFRWKFESKANALMKKVKIMGLMFVIFILTFGLYANFYIFKLMRDYPYLLPIGASLPWLGFLLGFIMSTITRRKKEQAIAIAIETGFQNIGIALLILKFSMPQPSGDLGAVMPIIVALFTPIPLYFSLAGLTIKRKYCDEKKEIEGREMKLINKDQNEVLMDDKQLLPA